MSKQPAAAVAAIAAIAKCISAFAGAATSRGIWKRERELAAKLGGRAIDLDTAAAARRLGEWLRQCGGRA